MYTCDLQNRSKRVSRPAPSSITPTKTGGLMNSTSDRLYSNNDTLKYGVIIHGSSNNSNRKSNTFICNNRVSPGPGQYSPYKSENSLVKKSFNSRLNKTT